MSLKPKNQTNLFIRLVIIIFISCSFSVGYSQNGVAINTTGNAANSSAMLDVTSTTAGMLIPRMTAAQRIVIPVSAGTNGLMVYQTDAPAGFYYYNSAIPAWVQLSSASGNGNYIFNQTTPQASSNFNISNAGVIGTTLNVGGLSTLNGITNTGAITSSGGTISLNVGSGNNTTIGGSGNSTTTLGGSGASTTNINSGNGGININNSTVSGGISILSGNGGIGINTSGNNNVTIGSSSSNFLLPKFINPGTLLYVANATGNISATAPGTSGQVLTSNGGGAPTWSTPTTGTVNGSGAATQVAFWNGTSVLSGEDELWWDKNNNRLGIGINSPSNTLTVFGTLKSSNGNIGLNESSNFNTTINLGTSTGSVFIGGALVPLINIGTQASTASSVLNLGSAVVGNNSSTNINSGTGGVDINAGNSQPTNINTGTNTGTVSIGTGTGPVTIGGNGNQTINVGASLSSGGILTLGSTGGDGANSTTNIYSGLGGINIKSAGTGGAVNINASNNQPTNINTGNSNKDVTIGNSSSNLILPKFITTGSVLYSSAGSVVAATTTGTSGQVLTSSGGGAPTWTTPSTGSVTSVTASAPLNSSGGSTPNISLTGIVPIANGGTNIGTIGSAGSIIYSNGTQHASTAVGTAGQVLTSNGALTPTWTTAASGTVTSVGLALPNIFSVSGSPVTTSGTLTGTLVNQSANTVLAGPISGGNATPTFRALVAADLPTNSGNYIQNQNAATQTADFKISGTGTLNALVSNASITNTGTLTSTAGIINLNSTGSANFATNINAGSSTGLVTIGGNATQNINIGTAVMNGSIVSLGSTSASDNSTTTNINSGSGGTNVNSGTGGVSINKNNNQATNINTGTSTGNVTIGNTNSSLILPKFTTNGTVFYTTGGTGTVSGLTPGTNGQVLTLTAGLPIWQAPATSGTVTNFSSGNLLPLFTTSVTTSTTTPALSFTLNNAAAHTFFGNFTNNPTTPSFGSPLLASADFANQGPTTSSVLHGNPAGNPSWGLVNITSDVIGILPIASGGTNIGTIGLAGSVIYSNGAQHASTAVGTTGQVLTSNGALTPTWTTATNGTVTSIGLALPNIFSVSGSPVTSSGTLTGTLVNQSANTVFAGPISGGNATPAFRALVVADLPSLAASYIQNQISQQASSNFNISSNGTIGGNLSVTGTSTLTGAVTSNGGITNTGILSSTGGAINLNTTSTNATNINTGSNTGNVTIGNSTGNVNLPKLSASAIVLTDAAKNLTSTATLAIVNGGTNSTAVPTNGGIAYGTGTAYAFTAVGASGQVLTSNGAGVPTWASAASSLASLTNGSGIASLNYNGSAAATVSLANGTAAGQVYVTGASPFTPTLVTMSGDATISSTGALLLATVNGNVGTFNNVTVNAKGLVTAASNVAYASLSSFSATAPLTYNSGTGTFGITQAGTSSNGYLSSADWNTFNSKQAALSGTGYSKFTGSTVSYVPSIPNTDLANSSISINGTSVPLGGTRNLVLASADFANQGTTTTVLHGNAAGNISWGAVNLTSDVSNILPVTNGGTNIGTIGAAGSVIYSNGTQHASTAVGTAGEVLTSNGAGAPTWSAAAIGTVTSVDISLPSIFTVSGNPITSSGILTGTLANQNANLVFAGPASGGAAAPTFRTLVVADLPVGSSSYIQSQSASSQNANYWIDGPASIGTSTFNSSNQLDVAISGANNNAIVAANTAAAGTGSGDGIEGITSQSQGAGLRATNTNTSGTGIIAAGNNQTASVLTVGSGGAFTGETTGIYARYNSTVDGSSALYTESNAGDIVEVNAYSSGTQYKIIGAGVVSTTAENLDNTSKVVLHAPEAPEVLFEDYGQGKLINGKVHINIDPLFSKNVAVNDKHPLRVFIQLEGDCNGVYVTNKSKTGFDVVELQKGNSNVSFQWHIVCNRANENLGNGKVSHNEDMRFEPAPQKMQNLNSKNILQQPGKIKK